MDTLERLQDWYFSRCDGDWEHDSGFTIELIDNPGWMIRLRVPGIALGDLTIPCVSEMRGEHDWISIRNNDGHLQIACGPRNLVEAMDRFLEIVLKSPSRS
jgi:hypothetical protein